MSSLRVHWRGSYVGLLEEASPDMYYLEGRWASASTPTARDFEALTGVFEPKRVMKDPTKGTRVLLFETAGSDVDGMHAVVMALTGGRLFLRRVVDPVAVQWLIANVK